MQSPGETPSEPDVLFEHRFFPSPWQYRVEVDDEDRAVLQEWKQEVERIRAEADFALATMQQTTTGQRSDMQLALSKAFGGEVPSDEEKTLFAIGRFLIGRQKVDPNGKRATGTGLRKFLWGGTHHMREFGTVENYDNCVDVPAVARALASSFGIEGEVKNNPNRDTWHYFFRTPEGKIIDTIFGEKRGGVFRTPEEQLVAAKAFLDAQRHQSRKQMLEILGMKKGDQPMS